MKRMLLMGFMLLIVYFRVQATTYTWTGTSMNNSSAWFDADNWSPAVIPVNSNSTVIIFNSSANVVITDFPNSVGGTAPLMSVDNIQINGGSTVVFSNSTGSTRTFNFEGAAGLTISSGSTLKLDGANRTSLVMNGFSTNSQVDGTLELGGIGASTNGSELTFPSTFSSNPKISFNSGARLLVSGINAVVNASADTRLFFNSGSFYDITRDGGTIMNARYKAGATIRVLGNVSSVGFTGISNSNVPVDADVEWNCPSQGSTGTMASWGYSSLGGSTFTGTFRMKAGYLMMTQNTANKGFTLGNVEVSGGKLAFRTTTSTALPNQVTITGNLTVTGGQFLCNDDLFSGGSMQTVAVLGNVIQSGGIINLGGFTGAGVLNVSGDVTQTAGTMTETGTSTTSALVFKGSTVIQNATFSGTVSGDKFTVITNNNSKHVNLLSNATLPYRLQLTSGNMILGNKNLTVTEKVLGSRTGGHVVTDGTGTLTIKSVDNAGKDFPVGVSNASHDAVWVTNASGTADFTIRVGTVINPVANLIVANILPRQWEITSASAGANLEFDPDPSAGAQTAPKIVSQYINPTWVESNAVIGVNIGYPYSANFTTFTSFVVGAGIQIPVELTSFSAVAKNKSNLLSWTTATERNVSHFNVERSANGRTEWATIGTVKAKGNSQGLMTYNLVDDGPLSSSYYRLTSVDFDGKQDVSKVVSVNRSANALKINSLSPMPFTEEALSINLQSNSSALTITLTDVSGKVIQTEKRTVVEGTNTLTLPLSNVAKGLYFLTVSDGRSTVVEKIVKQ
jgi:hypothetical protein